MVEENFEIWPSVMLQLDLILLLLDNYYFTMVEENFEIWPVTLQLDLIVLSELYPLNIRMPLYHTWEWGLLKKLKEKICKGGPLQNYFFLVIKSLLDF